MAPFMPFLSEHIYQKVRSESDSISVHLETWPENRNFDVKTLHDMELARKVVSEVLMSRSKAGIKVRQPLGLLKIQDDRLKGKNELVELIKDEINVKEVVFDKQMNEGFFLDPVITEELA